MKIRKRRLVIYLADLTHTGIRIATDYMPLNIGVIASYALKELGKDIEIKLFKYPDKLFSELREGRCDILGCSTYVWNNNLSEFACKVAKRHNPEVITVRGGWNFPLDKAQQRSYMLKHKFTDIFCLFEGETAFANAVKRALGVGRIDRWDKEPLVGSVFIDRNSNALVEGGILPRLNNLAQIPSPYTTGLLDEFFDGRLIPMIETARGCPFSCNYCNNAHEFYKKMEFFPAEYTAEEIDYIARRMKVNGITNLMFADTNFGMYPRDKEIAVALKKAQDKYGRPMNIQATTGKNKIEQIVEILSVLGNSLGVCMSVQSMHDATLKAIQRDNISSDMYRDLIFRLSKNGMSQYAELIAPLPQETYDSYMKGAERLIKLGAKMVVTHTLQINNGTIYKNDDFKKRYGYEGKFRLLSYDFGTYEGERVFDYEEVGTFNKTLKLDEYYKIRKFALVMDLLINNDILQEMFLFLGEKGVAKFDFLRYVLDNLDKAGQEVRSVFNSFVSDTMAEIKEAEQDLLDFYSTDQNYERVGRGEIGGSIIFKHKGIMFRRHTKEWLDYVFDCVKKVLNDGDGVSALSDEIGDIKSFIFGKLFGLFALERSPDDVIISSRHDLLRWLYKERYGRLEDFKMSGKKRKMRFYFDEQQKSERIDLFARYGSDISGIAQILARIPPLERLYRKVEAFE